MKITKDQRLKNLLEIVENAVYLISHEVNRPTPPEPEPADKESLIASRVTISPHRLGRWLTELSANNRKLRDLRVGRSDSQPEDYIRVDGTREDTGGHIRVDGTREDTGGHIRVDGTREDTGGH